ncbi:MAG: hypothetical protein ACNA8K_01140 [Cyclonatronaceae bacterium]
MTPDLILLYLAVSGGTWLNDRDLARRIRNGDFEAFRQFFDDHKGILTGFLRKRQVPDDIAAEVLDVSIKTVENHTALALKTVRDGMEKFR